MDLVKSAGTGCTVIISNKLRQVLNYNGIVIHAKLMTSSLRV